MKKFIILSFILAGISIYSCISPSEPEGIKSKHLVTIDTGGYCRDIDIKDSLLVAAADENGYQVYKFTFRLNNDIDYHHLYGGNYLDDDGLADKVESVLISIQHNFFLMLEYPDIFFYRSFRMDDEIYDVPTDIEPERENVRSMTMDESKPETVILYTLSKRIFMDSTYISIKYLYVVDNPDSTVLIFGAGFDSHSGIGLEARKIYFSDSLLSISNSQLGVIVLKQNEDGGLSEFTNFDTPGEVKTVYSTGNYIFAGLSDDKGCTITLLDSAGGSINTVRIAEGYLVKGIHLKGDILALACGNDGVLLYNWLDTGEGIEVDEMGVLDSEYAYNVKVYNSQIIFIATRSGIQIFKLER